MAGYNLSRLNPHEKSLAQLLIGLSRRHSLHRVFRDFVEAAAIAVSNSVDRSQFAAREARYLQIAAAYEREELNSFGEGLAMLTMALDGDMHDALGRLFMTLELGNEWGGQFFTPYEVSKLMSALALHDGAEEVQARIARHGFVTVNEPACGAGAMAIALAETLLERGVNYQQQLHLVAQDVDPTACHMAYLQLSLLHVPAVVILGNTLLVEERAHWYTPAHVLGGWGRRLARRAQDRPLEAQTQPPPPEAAQAPAGADRQAPLVLVPAAGGRHEAFEPAAFEAEDEPLPEERTTAARARRAA